MDINIRRIDKEQAWLLRHLVMWPEKEFDFIKLDDDGLGKHYGLFEGDELVSVVSLFAQGDQAQFRKFATLATEQNKGYGSRLLSYVIGEAERAGVKRIYCNARVNKVAFYEKFGLRATGSAFSKSGKDYVIMERCYLSFI
ncbi:N-acetyltransferase [Paenibacillus agaridevorans]|uniref:N-acetyltransferase n=1 Tax=Paenibacillus agaridevorans TaxID=171404 RepID=A0A2R5EWN0_9BACL|nr:N-acetyltransferase [Paenibacillus agaridevorans]